MANISVPNVFVNSSLADATQVNQNFNAITTGLVNGANDFAFANLQVTSGLSVSGLVQMGATSIFSAAQIYYGTGTFQGALQANSSVSFAQSSTYSGAAYFGGSVQVNSSVSFANTATFSGSVKLGTSEGIVRATAGLVSATTAVANADLATVATQTIKGRTTASTGIVEDLTATQATAILSAMVGDSGAGGTKGLVPAPASGDALNYLRGSGTFLKLPTYDYFSGFQTATNWTRNANTYADGTNSGGNALTSRVSLGLTVTAGASNIMGITLTPAATTDVFYVVAKFSAFNTGANNSSFRLTDGTNVLDDYGVFGTNVNPIVLEGIWAPGSISAQTIKIQMAASAGTTQIDNEHVSGLSTAVINWKVFRIR
jgi:hypothetical protein